MEGSCQLLEYGPFRMGSLFKGDGEGSMRVGTWKKIYRDTVVRCRQRCFVIGTDATIDRSLGPAVAFIVRSLRRAVDIRASNNRYSRRAAPAALAMGGCLRMTSHPMEAC